MRFEQSTQTPEAFANSSPGLERSDNPGNELKIWELTLKGFDLRETLTPSALGHDRLKLANAFGVEAPMMR